MIEATEIQARVRESSPADVVAWLVEQGASQHFASDLVRLEIAKLDGSEEKAFDPSLHPRSPTGQFAPANNPKKEGRTHKQARKNYNQLFALVREGLGLPPGTAPPNLIFIPSGRGYTLSGADAHGQVINIYMNPSAAKQLASKDPKKREAAEYAIFHEFGRLWGSDAQWTTTDGNTGAGRANAFANQATRLKRGKISKSRFRRWAKHYMPKWGKDPATIILP